MESPWDPLRRLDLVHDWKYSGFNSDGTFEWWYVHAVTLNEVISLVFHETDMLGNRELGPYCSVAILNLASQTLREERLPPESVDLEFSESRPSILCRLSRGEVLNIRWDEQLSPTRENSWRLHNPVLACAENRLAFWSVPMLREKTTVIHRINEREVTAHGWCYIDHNWGNLLMQDAFSAWRWAVWSDGSETRVFGEVVPRDGVAIDVGNAKRTALEGVLGVDIGALILAEGVPSGVAVTKIKDRHYRGAGGTAHYARLVVSLADRGPIIVEFVSLEKESRSCNS
jgi:hypothetical protein